mmetsp:Transcript_21123/g.48812  ORF Transcript_21123/g.48812 Transcript_21123/m.48812 type:complete len:220 (+) Transcript_21123:249-908(+)
MQDFIGHLVFGEQRPPFGPVLELVNHVVLAVVQKVRHLQRRVGQYCRVARALLGDLVHPRPSFVVCPHVRDHHIVDHLGPDPVVGHRDHHRVHLSEIPEVPLHRHGHEACPVGGNRKPVARQCNVGRADRVEDRGLPLVTENIFRQRRRVWPTDRGKILAQVPVLLPIAAGSTRPRLAADAVALGNHGALHHAGHPSRVLTHGRISCASGREVLVGRVE